MEDKRLVATKKDIIIFFVISMFFSVLSISISDKPIKLELYYLIILFYITPIIALIINNIIKYKNIKNELTLKIIKILFNIFSFLFFIFIISINVAGYIAVNLFK